MICSKKPYSLTLISVKGNTALTIKPIPVPSFGQRVRGPHSLIDAKYVLFVRSGLRYNPLFAGGAGLMITVTPLGVEMPAVAEWPWLQTRNQRHRAMSSSLRTT
ncbi:hypothetical protein TNCV_2265961 [Trichonephila clavipes]|nr:hypothetical protein TNCV_2265961 [Trichonephila clavipes]